MKLKKGAETKLAKMPYVKIQHYEGDHLEHVHILNSLTSTSQMFAM